MKVNDQTIDQQNVYDFDDLLLQDVSSIEIRSTSYGYGHYVNIYYLELNEVTDFTILEGTSDGNGDLIILNDETTFSSTEVTITTANLAPYDDDATEINWELPSSGDHYDNLKVDDSYIQEDAEDGDQWTEGVLDLFDLDPVPGNFDETYSRVSKIRVYVLSKLESKKKMSTLAGLEASSGIMLSGQVYH